ncbi:MAG: DUF975 family protein [Lentisphaeria bacterium]|nr:DUF975 family protein [Lentisphaeria bacterium]
MLDRIALKRQAKVITREARVSAYLFTLLYLAIINVLDVINTYVNASVVTYMEEFFPGVPVPAFLLHAQSFSPVMVMFVSVLVALLTSVLSAGCAIYHLGIHRGEEMSFSSIFDGFSFVGKVILLEIVMYIYIFLGTLFFVIPGIIAAYRYRFALYNLCENPEMGVMEAMGMSNAQTQGYKGELFILDLTFFGWQFLCGLTLGVLSIWIAPYIIQTELGYFQQIKKIKGIGWFAPEDQQNDGEFHAQDPFGPDL